MDLSLSLSLSLSDRNIKKYFRRDGNQEVKQGIVCANQLRLVTEFVKGCYSKGMENSSPCRT